MNELFADDFFGIPAVLTGNLPLRERMAALAESAPIAGKVTEGGNRLATFRDILVQFVAGGLTVQQAIGRVQSELSRTSSPYGADNRVFADGWAERLVRTQVSRFYNQAVMELLLSRGETECFVPHASTEQASSQCSQVLAGRSHSIRALYDRLVSSYADGRFDRTPKIPDHPHCTHVVRPVTARVVGQPAMSTALTRPT